MIRPLPFLTKLLPPCLAWVLGLADAPAAGEAPALTRLTEHVWVYRGAVNVGIVRDGPRALLIDCGDGQVQEALIAAGVSRVEQILFTHAHRDQACGAAALLAAGARTCVPAKERALFEAVEEYWRSPKNRWHLYSHRPAMVLAEPIRVDGVCAEGQELGFGPARIRVLETPGHTDGSVSFVVEADGQRVIFCGDTLYGPGQLWDAWSLQKGTLTSDYHGFLGARSNLVASLQRLKSAQPHRLVPSHGPLVDQPDKAVDTLIARLDRAYDQYVAVSALRHYFPKLFAEYAGRKDHMPFAPTKPPPDCLRHVGTSWILVSRDQAAFVMDCGGPKVIEALQAWQAKGEIRSVEGLWITHYHDDHVDAVPKFQQTFDCPCLTDRHVAQVITDPMAWRLPCVSPGKVRVDRPTRDGESWTWHEFKLTAYHFPGQTLYHAGLLVEQGALRMFFAGDSFTPAGIDDYCAWNRNWLGRGVGFDRCVALLEKLRPTHIFNCHVADAFQFTRQQYRFLRANLAERERLFAELFPWDHPNYGLDEAWVRCHPYEQEVPPGGRARIRVVVTNHSSRSHRAEARAVLPAGLGGKATGWTSSAIPKKTEGQLPLEILVPTGAVPGRYVVPVDLRYAGWTLPQFKEAIVVVR